MTAWTTVWNVNAARIAVLALLACAACGDDSDDGNGDGRGNGGRSGEPCVSGTSWSCFGSGNCQGRQICNAEGVLGPCQCFPMPMTDGGQPSDGGNRADSGGDPGRDASSDAATSGDAGPDAASDNENCNNDRDDDGDGNADCADSDCSARTCVAEPPSGWFGPVLLYEGDSAPPACSGEYPDEDVRGGTGVAAGPATCSTCTCTPTNPGCASFLNFETSLSTTCGAAPAGTCTFPVNSCQELTSPCLTQPTGYVEALVPDGLATCAASAQSPTTAPADWDRHALACAPDRELARAGCGSDELCAPERPFDGELCIYDYFDVPCPDGPYTDRRVYGTHIADTRSCSDCQCAHDCAYTWRVFDAADTTCAGAAVATLTAENECVAITPGSGGRVRVNTTIAGTGACTASGGTATGSALSQNPITVCCLP